MTQNNMVGRDTLPYDTMAFGRVCGEVISSTHYHASNSHYLLRNNIILTCNFAFVRRCWSTAYSFNLKHTHIYGHTSVSWQCIYTLSTHHIPQPINTEHMHSHTHTHMHSHTRTPTHTPTCTLSHKHTPLVSSSWPWRVATSFFRTASSKCLSRLFIQPVRVRGEGERWVDVSCEGEWVWGWLIKEELIYFYLIKHALHSTHPHNYPL